MNAAIKQADTPIPINKRPIDKPNNDSEKAKNIGIHGTIHENVNDAIAAANKNAHPDDLIIVMGSIFLVAEVSR